MMGLSTGNHNFVKIIIFKGIPELVSNAYIEYLRDQLHLKLSDTVKKISKNLCHF